MIVLRFAMCPVKILNSRSLLASKDSCMTWFWAVRFKMKSAKWIFFTANYFSYWKVTGLASKHHLCNHFPSGVWNQCLQMKQPLHPWTPREVEWMVSPLGWLSSVELWSHSCVQLFAIPWTVADQAPLSMGILQARILVAMPSSRGSSQPRDKTQVSCIAADCLPSESPAKPHVNKPILYFRRVHRVAC